MKIQKLPFTAVVLTTNHSACRFGSNSPKQYLFRDPCRIAVGKQAFLHKFMIYSLHTIGFPDDGSSTVHIYTQTVYRTTENKQYTEQHKNFGRVRTVPCIVFYSVSPGKLPGNTPLRPLPLPARSPPIHDSSVTRTLTLYSYSY